MAIVNGVEMDLTPTEGMRTEAQRYRDWKDEGQAGGTDVAARRASQILSGDELSPDTVVTMSAWFARHEVDKQGEGFSPGEDGYPSPGRVAWAAWGGDPGKTWSDRHVGHIQNDEDRSSRAAADSLSTGDFVAWQSSGGTARGRIEHIMREGTLGVPDSDFSIEATAEDPAALIRIYRPSGEGWQETETLVGHKFSTLRKIDALSIAKEDEGDDTKLSQSPETPSGATTPLSGEDTMSTAPTEELERIAAKPIDLLRINKEGLRREVSQGVRVEDSTDQGLTFSFSSEAPVERWWGKEVLMHDEGAMDLGRMNDGGAYLWNHNRDVVLGVAEKAWLGADRRLYTTVKWSPNTTEKGTEEYKRRRDIEAGITRNVSFAYEIGDMREAANGEMQVTKWNVLEVSSVSVPADQTVGLGRALSSGDEAEAAHTAEELMQPDNVMLGTKQSAERGTEATSPAPLTMEQSIDIQEVQSAARAAERDRVASIRAMCSQHQVGDETADRLINNDSTLDQAREAVLNQIGRTRVEIQGRLHDDNSIALGLTDKEVRSFSFVRALNHLVNPGDRTAREAAAFEIEVGKAAAAKYERSSNGIVIPNEVLRRDLVVSTSTAGGNLVASEVLSGSFIELLRNRMAMMQAGVTMLSGLQGNISLPRQSSAATAYWVGESASPTESQQAIDQVNMTPKTVGAFVDYSRRLLLQSSIDVESMIRADLAKVIGLELDRAAIYGTGSTNQPLGLVNTTGVGTQTITTFGTFAEYIGMETDVAAANADAGSMRYIINASARGALKGTEKSTSSAGQFVFEKNEINGYPAIVSNQLGTNDCLFGDFSQFVVGMWSGLDLTVDPFAGATAGTVRVIALQDVDFAVKQPGAFCFGT